MSNLKNLAMADVIATHKHINIKNLSLASKKLWCITKRAAR